VHDDCRGEGRGNHEPDRPCFHFEYVSLTTKVFDRRSAILCPDAVEAMKKGLISSDYQRKLHLSGPMLGFPIYVRSYIVGVMIIWRRDGEKKSLGWPDMELFRRASHLIANAGSRSKLGSDEPTRKDLHAEVQNPILAERIADARKNLAGIGKVVDIVTQEDLLSHYQKHFDASARPENKEYDSDLGNDWQEIGAMMAQILWVLWKRYREYREQWLVPTRCRLRVVDKSLPRDSSKYCFVLVLEVSLDKDILQDSVDNVYARSVTIKNLYTRQGENDHKVLVTESEEKKKGRDDWKFDIERFLGKRKSKTYEITPADRYLTFLLSRINADRFTRLQEPAKDDADKQAGILGKKAEAKWYVSPVLVVDSDPNFSVMQKETFETEPTLKLDKPQNEPPFILEIEKGKGVESGAFRDLVAYLVFDADPGHIGDPPKEGSEELAALQDELIHTLDLFTSCLAEKGKFRNLVLKANSSAN